jgi:AcrR family transcriptional regulator
MADSTFKTSVARQLLLSAAQDLYAINGVAATTPRQVLARSGVGQGSLYHHFPSKQELASTAVKRTVEQSLQGAAEILVGAMPARQRIVSYLRRDRDAVAGCRVGRLTADPLVMSDDDLRDSVSSYFSALIELMMDAFVEDGVVADTARDRATTAVAVVQGGYVLSRALGDARHMQRAVEGLVALMDDAT